MLYFHSCSGTTDHIPDGWMCLGRNSGWVLLFFLLSGSAPLVHSIKFMHAGNKHGEISDDVISLLKSIFACGDCKTVEEYTACNGVTLEDIKQHPWFLKDLKDVEMRMAEDYRTRTLERQNSAEYKYACICV